MKRLESQYYLAIQTFLSSSLLPGGYNANAASVSWTNAVNSNKAASNKQAGIFILKSLFRRRATKVIVVCSILFRYL